MVRSCCGNGCRYFLCGAFAFFRGGWVKPSVYYNEFDPFAAKWLRELIKAKQIPDGVVDDRDMREVQADELAGFTQCHFFAGIGGWSLALKLAGWPENRPVWTGSPPCQPFSSAGKQQGVNDERHLAPVFLELVKTGRPAALFGEQVATAVKKDNWLDDLLNELEAEGYTTGAAVLPACGLDAPHIRQRLWFCAKRVGDTLNPRLEGHTGDGNRVNQPGWQQAQPDRSDAPAGSDGGVADTSSFGRMWWRASEESYQHGTEQRSKRLCNADEKTRPTDSHHLGWDNPDWLFCRDGKRRPVESIIEPRLDVLSDRLGYSRFGDRYSVNPLIEKAKNRVGRLRGYGNAIVPQLAAEVIKASGIL